MLPALHLLPPAASTPPAPPRHSPSEPPSTSTHPHVSFAWTYSLTFHYFAFLCKPSESCIESSLKMSLSFCFFLPFIFLGVLGSFVVLPWLVVTPSSSYVLLFVCLLSPSIICLPLWHSCNILYVWRCVLVKNKRNKKWHVILGNKLRWHGPLMTVNERVVICEDVNLLSLKWIAVYSS